MLRRLATAVAVIATLAFGVATPALAQADIPFTGQGTNADGTCESFERDRSVNVPAGQQAWHFVLNQQGDPESATIDATFDDGTTVTDQGPTRTSGPVAHFYVFTAQGAALVSATAHPAGDQGRNPQFVVSHCVKGKKGDDGDGNGDDGKDDENGKDDDNGKDDENGNGKDDDGKKDGDVKETPKPAVPTSVPAGVADSASSNTAGMIGLLAVFAGMAAGVAVLVRRRFVEGN